MLARAVLVCTSHRSHARAGGSRTIFRTRLCGQSAACGGRRAGARPRRAAGFYFAARAHSVSMCARSSGVDKNSLLRTTKRRTKISLSLRTARKRQRATISPQNLLLCTWLRDAQDLSLVRTTVLVLRGHSRLYRIHRRIPLWSNLSRRDSARSS